MPNFKDWSGCVFGKVTVSDQHKRQGHATMWLVVCACGKEWWTRQPDRLKDACWECTHIRLPPEYHRRRATERMQEWRLKNWDAYQVKRKRYYTENREKCNAATRRWQQAHKERVRDNRFLRRYGLTPQQYSDLLTSQAGLCAICKCVLSAAAHGPQVDHCHESGNVRGLLCILCNTGLGKFREDPDMLRKALAYLESGGRCIPAPGRT